MNSQTFIYFQKFIKNAQNRSEKWLLFAKTDINAFVA